MADKQLTFNSAPITEADALEKLKEIYGEKRPPEIIAGLKSGKYRCASVAGGHIVWAEPPAEKSAEPPAASAAVETIPTS